MKRNKHKKLGTPTQILERAALQFIADSSPIQFSRSLRKLLLDYISQNKDGLPLDFDVCLNDFNNLFALLDVLDDEHMKKLQQS